MSLPSSDAIEFGPWQRGILLEAELDPDGVAYHMGFVVTWDQPVGDERLREACSVLVARFPELRTAFDLSHRRRRIASETEVDYEFRQLSDEEELSASCRAEMGRPFDLTSGQPIRFRAFAFPGSAALLVVAHHAVFDDRSKDVLVAELHRLLAGAAPASVTPSRTVADPCPDLTMRPVPELVLPSPHRVGRTVSSAGDEVRLDVDPRPVRDLAERLGCTPFEAYLSALTVVLRRYGNRQPLVTVIGSTRTAAEANAVGCYVNSMPLVFPEIGDPTFAELVPLVRQSLTAAYRLRRVPFPELVDATSPWRGSLFQMGLTYVEGEQEVTDLPTRGAKAPLLVGVRSGPLVDRVRIEYSTELFDRPSVVRMADHLSRVLAAAAANPDVPLSGVDLVESESDEATVEFPGETLCDLFAARAAETPDAVAVVSGSESVTYGELARRVDRFAAHLRAQGAGPGQLVAVQLDRRADMVTALLAVLFAGAAYVPLDPDYPPDRLRFMLDDCDAGLLLTAVPEEADLLDGPLGERPAPEDLAYVIYTSGSTGTPKGVMIEHRAVANLLGHFVDTIGLGPGDVWVAVTTLSFDIACLELFGPLVAGATLVVAPSDAALDPVGLAELLTTSGATVLQATPSAWRLLVDGGGTWPKGLTALCGGEALSGELAAAIVGRTRTLWNVYGPTETTIWSTVAPIGAGVSGPPPIGRPIRNTVCRVLDEYGARVPEWIPGELHIGGAGLARGYLNRPELTAERFVDGRLYRTGDLVRRRDDGDLEYLGRLDHQVKIRGHRIECGEVEAALTAHPAITEAIVVARPDVSGTEDILVGYVVGEADERELHAHLARRLPRWMVPSALVILDGLPRTPNGKVDRAALPRPGSRSAREVTPPRTPVEQQLVAVWQEILGLDRVGVDDDFFELGGNSLRAVRLVNRLRESFRVDLPLVTMFTDPTVARLAARLSASHPAVRTLTRRPDDSEPVLSYAQERLWALDQIYPDSPAYVIPLRFRIRGRLDRVALDRALSAIFARHEPLRTRFILRDGRPRQVVDDATEVPSAYTDLTGLDREPAYAKARELAAAAATQPFDLADGPVFRTHLIRIAEAEHLLFVSAHHIAFDGWSIGVFTRELGVLYSGSPLPDPVVSYSDYAWWQRDGYDRDQLGYWQKRLAGLPMLELPIDRPRSPTQTADGGAHPVAIPAEVAARLRRLAAVEDATVFMVLLAAFQLLLARYANQTDVVVGSPVTDRGRPDLEPLIGVFLNLLVLRTDTSGGPSFRELLGRVRETVLGAWSHQDVPFEQVVAGLGVERDLAHHPLVQAVFTLNVPAEPLRMTGLETEPFPVGTQATRYDLELELTDEGGAITGSLIYNRRLFLDTTVERIAGQLEALLDAVAGAPDTPVDRLSLLSAAERRKVLVEWNDTAVAHRPASSVADLFEGQATRTPDAVALVGGSEVLTYAELNRRSDRLAVRLRADGAGPGTLVAVQLERSPGMVVALLATLKAGAAYLPLNPDDPENRRRLLLDDSGARLVLTSADPGPESPGTGTPPAAASPDDLAYVIYTSGSTGTPKGVEIPQRGLINRLDWMQAEYDLRATDRVLQKTPMTFDVAGWEVFWPLVTGSALVLAAPGRHVDPAYLLGLMTDERITVTHFVPSMLQAFLTAVGHLPSPPSLRLVVCSGEALPPALARQLTAWAPAAELHNLYGPTEASIDVSSWRYEPRPDGRIPIGRPIHNTQLYVLDDHLAPVPVGMPGELYIGGIGLASGYRNHPDLTDDRFVPNPFGEPGSRLYRTGDRARFLDDGNIDYLGRIDHQVKIRGVRIELGEIEATLLARPGVTEAAVTATSDGRLVAYVVSTETAAALRAALAESLPAAMIPAVFVPLAALPLTSSGKLDRAALPAPPADRPVRSDHTEPRNQVERVLSEIWARLLRVPRVGVHDNFFDLGGDSLIAIHIVASARVSGIAVTVRQFFAHQSVAALAAVAGIAVAGPRDRPVHDSVALTPIQRWFLDQNPPDAHHFNQAFLFEIPGELDSARLENALRSLVARHETLRLRFTRKADGWRAIVAPVETAPLLVHDGDWASVQASLNLSDGPLIRAARSGDRLLIVVHHLAVDAVSWRVIVEDLVTAYRSDGRAGTGLPWETTSFQEWAHRLTTYAASPELAAERGYWTATTAAVRPLPHDGATSAGTLATAAEVWSELDPDVTADLLTKVPAAYHTRTDDVLLCALADVLTGWSGHPDVVVDLEGHGREDLFDDVDLSRTVGWFTSLFPVRLVSAPGGDPGAALVAIKEQLRAVPRRGLGYGLLRYLDPEPGSPADPPVRFNYLGRWEDSMRAGRPLLRRVDEPLGPTSAATMPRPYLLDLIAEVTGDRLRVVWEYQTEAHHRATIEQLSARYLARLREIVDHCTGSAGTQHTPSDFPLWRLLRPKTS